jgi:phage terminase large subunit-like protein
MEKKATHSITAIRAKCRELGYHFAWKNSAKRAVRFFERELVHVKGEWAGQPLRLEKWQRRIVKRVFGWLKADETRVVREVYIEVPRKNGKSFLASGFALFLLFGDKEAGAEIVSAAAETEQATIVYETARLMVKANHKLAKRCKPFRKSMAVYETASNYKVISADAYSKHGKNLHGIVVDELHAQPNRDLVDVLVTSTGSRRQPLIVYLTTAGFDRKSICWEKHEYGLKILDNIIEDYSFAPFIFAAGPDDDWRKPETWAKANPNLNISKKLAYMERECTRAMNTPAYENTFRRLDLNQWTEQNVRAIAMHQWDACSRQEDELEGKQCFAGLDMSTTHDITAFSLVFPLGCGEYAVKPTFFLPEDAMIAREKKDRVPYPAWVREGLILTTPGPIVDYDFVLKEILRQAEIYNIKEIAIDRWNATQIAIQIQNAGQSVCFFGQGYASMSAPTKELLNLVLSCKLAHGGNKVLRWMASNLAVETDAAGNLKPSKKKSSERIDGIAATIMGLGRAMVNDESSNPYSERGFAVLG